MSEAEFAQKFADRISPHLPEGMEIETKISLLYSVCFDDSGALQLGLNNAGEPIRGGGTGFEQDVLIFERTPGKDTSIIPRVILEVKLNGVTTHDAIVYSEKARRIRSIYPYLRYGLLLGGMFTIPGRVLRLGQEFDFIATASEKPPKDEVDWFVKAIKREIKASKDLGDLLSDRKKATALFRNVSLETT